MLRHLSEASLACSKGLAAYGAGRQLVPVSRSAAWLGCKFFRKKIIAALLVPHDAEHPPAGAVVEKLNTIDAASKRFLGRGVARLITAEDLGDITETLDAIDDGGFEESVLREVCAGAFDVIVDGEETNRGSRGVNARNDGSEASFGDEQGAEAVPVTFARRTGDDVVNSVQDGVDRGNVSGFGGRDT